MDQFCFAFNVFYVRSEHSANFLFVIIKGFGEKRIFWILYRLRTAKTRSCRFESDYGCIVTKHGVWNLVYRSMRTGLQSTFRLWVDRKTDLIFKNFRVGRFFVLKLSHATAAILEAIWSVCEAIFLKVGAKWVHKPPEYGLYRRPFENLVRNLRNLWRALSFLQNMILRERGPFDTSSRRKFLC